MICRMVVVPLHCGGSPLISFCSLSEAFWDGAAFLSAWRALRCQPLFLSLLFSHVFVFLFLPANHGSLSAAALLGAQGSYPVPCLPGCGHNDFLFVFCPMYGPVFFCHSTSVALLQCHDFLAMIVATFLCVLPTVLLPRPSLHSIAMCPSALVSAATAPCSFFCSRMFTCCACDQESTQQDGEARIRAIWLQNNEKQ